MDMEEKKLETNTEQNLPVQELPADIPAEVRQKLAEDLNEEDFCIVCQIIIHILHRYLFCFIKG